MKKTSFIVVGIAVLAAVFFAVMKMKSMDASSDVKKIETTVTTSVSVTTKKEENLMDNITLNYQSSIRIEKDGKVIYFDPYKIDKTVNDADYIFITHSHYDHYSESDIKKVMKASTKFIVTNDLEDKIKNLGVSSGLITVAAPNNSYTVDDLKIDAITSYNITKTYHKKSYNWVGYNVTINGKKYYDVGDSDLTDEAKKVVCDVLFVPVGGTYTMDYKEAASLANTIKPKYAVPVHYDEVGSKTDAEDFVKNLDGSIKGIILKK